MGGAQFKGSSWNAEKPRGDAGMTKKSLSSFVSLLCNWRIKWQRKWNMKWKLGL